MNHEIIEWLSSYTIFLQKHGYIDTDATDEPPFAIDTFIQYVMKHGGKRKGSAPLVFKH